MPTEVSVVVNHVLELVCEADGIPLPSLTWLKDGRPLPQTDSIRLLRDGEVLRVASAQVGTKNGQLHSCSCLFLIAAEYDTMSQVPESRCASSMFIPSSADLHVYKQM